MKNKIIEFDAEKRNVKKAWEDFVAVINAAKPEDFKNVLFYLNPNAQSVTSHIAVYGIDWEMTGRMRLFIQDLEMEHYVHDFEDGTEDNDGD